MSIKKLLLFVFAVLLAFSIEGCGCKTASVPIQESAPIQIKLNLKKIKFDSEKIMYIHGAGAGAPTYFGPKTIFFKYNPLDGVKKNGEKFLEEFKNHDGVTLIVAHSYGTNLVVWAIENCSDLDAFKNVSVLLLAPTLAGVEDAIGASGFFPQMTMSFISLFGADYRVIAADQDPFGEMISGIWKYFSSFIQRTKEVVCMTVSGDDYKSTSSSSEIIKKNYRKLVPFSVELLSQTKEPHTEVLERKEVLVAMANMLQQ